MRNRSIATWSVLAALALGGVPAQAITRTSFAGGDMQAAYGNYAPRGDCAREPRVAIDATGLTFRALGKTIKPARFEHAVSYNGPEYQGIAAVIFPFMVSDDDFGRMLMTINDGEKPGVISFEANVGPGQRLDPFQAALVGASPLRRCGAAPAPSSVAVPAKPSAPATGLDWGNLAAFTGRYMGAEGYDLIERGEISAELRRLLGPRFGLLKDRLAVAGPLEREGARYFVSGNARHQGGVDQAYVLIDSTRRQVQVGLWEKGKLTVYRPASGPMPLPRGLQAFAANSPPAAAGVMAGAPWEVLPVAGRAPIASVDAAGSPSITSFSLFCEGRLPVIAMLLNKPSNEPAITLTWNFGGQLVSLPMRRGNREGTFWQASLAGSQLVPMLLAQRGPAMLGLNGRREGEVSLAKAPEVLRGTMRGCAAV